MSEHRILKAVLALMSLCTTLVAQAPPLVRMVLQEPDKLYVGQRIPFSIQVLTTARFDSNPRFDLPRVKGALLVQAPGKPVFGSDEVERESYTTYSFDFAIYAQREGGFEIPAIPVRVSEVLEIGKAPRESTLTTRSVRLKAIMPPGAEGLASVISTRSFLFGEDRWEPKPGRVEVGAAFTRSIRMGAEDVLGMSIPTLPLPRIDGMQVYAKQTLVHEERNHGVLYGVVEQVFVYVCERSGRFVVPPISVRWFDLEAGVMKTEILDAVNIEVVAGPGLGGAAAGKGDGKAAGMPPTWWLIVSLSVLGVLAVLWRYVLPHLARRWGEREGAWRVEVRRACLQNDAPEAHRTLMQALDRGPASATNRTAMGWARSHGAAVLQREVERLELAVVTSSDWNGSALSRCLPARLLPTAVSAKAESLPPLNLG